MQMNGTIHINHEILYSDYTKYDEMIYILSWIIKGECIEIFIIIWK